MRTILVHHDKKGPVSQEIEIGPHRLTADVGTDLGGGDSGPSPHELLASALGACSALTMRMYAQRKGWPLDDAQVSVSIVKEAGLTRFERKIELIGSLEAEQKTRLIEIANRCPVHLVLTGKIEVHTS